MIRVMAETSPTRSSPVSGSQFQNLWGRPLQLIDCQNLFCEVDKYARVAHPEVAGASGRTRIKQKFTPRPAPIPQWYPPKWGLTVDVPAPKPSGEASTAPRRRCAKAGEDAARP